MLWLDTLRVLAGLSMVGLHATSDAQGQAWAQYDPVERIVPVIIRTFLYMARTELIIIISIFLIFLSLARTPRPIFETYRTQFSRMGPAYLFWTAFFVLFTFIKAYSFGYLDPYIARLSDLNSLLQIVFLGEGKYHLHFVPTLLGVILLLPDFRCAFSNLWFA